MQGNGPHGPSRKYGSWSQQTDKHSLILQMAGHETTANTLYFSLVASCILHAFPRHNGMAYGQDIGMRIIRRG